MLILNRFLFTTALLVASFSLFAQENTNIEFVENKGQWDSKVLFRAEIDYGVIYMRSSGFTIVKHHQEDMERAFHMFHERIDLNVRAADLVMRSHAYDVDFVGASPTAKLVADKASPTINNYFIGNDPAKWAGECRIYLGLTLKDVYPGIDVRYYTHEGMLKYDIIAQPGADIRKIALKYTGADKLSIKDKQLVIQTTVGDLKEGVPYTYQYPAQGVREVLSSKYVVKGDVVTFDIKGHKPSSTLVIDPTMIFCSFSGSRANNWGFTATYGPDGSFYGGGIVFSGGSFPVNPGAFQTSFGGGSDESQGPIDIGIIKLSPNGNNRIYATYIGGSGNEQPHSLIVDRNGSLVLAGRSNSDNYPQVGGASSAGAGFDIVVTKLNPQGSALIGSAVIGGSGDDGVNIKVDRDGASSLQQNYGDDGRSEVILDGAGNIWVASNSRSTNFPGTAGSFQPTIGGKQDGIVLKLNPDATARIFASYLGGSENDAAYVLAPAPNGDMLVAGGTESANFPGNKTGTIGPSYNGSAGNADGFVAQINSSGTSLIRSTYIGTTGIDQIYGIQFDRTGFPYIMGTTTGTMPVINAAWSNPNAKQFIAKLQPDLSAYVYRTTFGTGASRPNISPTAFLVDRCENVYVSGWGGVIQSGYASAGTAGLPITPDAIRFPRNTNPDGKDFYFFVLQRDATAQLFGSFFGQSGGPNNGGGDHVDGGTSRFDANGVIYQGMCANCGGNAIPPTTPGVWAPTNLTPAQRGCNLGMVKIAFNLAGVGADVQSAIGGVPRDTAGCLPLEVTFTDLVRNATEYYWNFGDGTPQLGPLPAATGYTQTHTFTALGEYEVMLIAINPASCNERDTSYINIRVGDLRADLAWDFVKVGACTSLEYEFTNSSTTDILKPFTDTSFVWDFGDGSPRVRAGVGPVRHTFPAPGPYVVTLALNDTTYCNNPDSLTRTIGVAANVDAQFTTPPVGCVPYTAEFNTANTVGGLDFEWNFGDPTSPDNTSTLANPTHLYANTGTYRITLIVRNPNTCNLIDSTDFTIRVVDAPTAAFTYSPTTAEENTPNIFVNNSSANATRFLWDFGNGDTIGTSSRSNITYQYGATGSFNACLIAYNNLGCADTACQLVDVIVNPLLDVPNAFTPMSNDVNSVVKVRGFGIAKMRFMIFNRWGQKVFESANPNFGWDGRVKGTVQPMDVYAYTLDVEFFDGTKASKKGDITLIR